MSTLKKILSVTLSFIMLVSIAYTFIETVDPEPAFASGEFNCVDSDGRTYIYQSTWSNGTLTITRGINNDNGSFSLPRKMSFLIGHLNFDDGVSFVRIHHR